MEGSSLRTDTRKIKNRGARGPHSGILPSALTLPPARLAYSHSASQDDLEVAAFCWLCEETSGVPSVCCWGEPLKLELKQNPQTKYLIHGREAQGRGGGLRAGGRGRSSLSHCRCVAEVLFPDGRASGVSPRPHYP